MKARMFRMAPPGEAAQSPPHSRLASAIPATGPRFQEAPA